MHVERVAPDAMPRAAADLIAERIRTRTAAGGRFSLAVSGGHTPWKALAALAGEDLPWELVDVYQVDERIAPDGDPDRNLTGLRESLLERVPVVAHPMPVTDTDPDAAAARYAKELPARIDLVHLGMGPDGHTASLVPGDPVLGVTDRAVAVTGEYQGRRRMTLTFAGLERAGEIVWLVSGDDKAAMLDRMLAADDGIPSGRVAQDHATVITDIQG